MTHQNSKVALITGASSGFGWGTALAMAQAGYRIVVTARREARLQQLVAECQKLGTSAAYYVGDARKTATAQGAVAFTLEQFGRLDILVNNAGIGRVQKLVDTPMADFDLVMDTNVRSAFAFTKFAVPQMIKQHSGQLILVSSVTGIKGHAEEAAYTCSKFALRGLGQALDHELLPQGIRTCVFCPHAGATEFEVGHGRTSAEVAQSGFLTPEDVGAALVSVCEQPEHSRIVELRLASNNVPY